MLEIGWSHGPMKHVELHWRKSFILLLKIIDKHLIKVVVTSYVSFCNSPKLDLDYSYSELSDIVQLDGPADNTGSEEEERVPLEESDFLGMINAEAIKALQEGEASSNGTSISSSSDSEGADDLANVEEEVRELLTLSQFNSANDTSVWKAPAEMTFIIGIL